MGVARSNRGWGGTAGGARPGGGLRAGLHSERVGGTVVTGQAWGQQVRAWWLWLLGQLGLLDRHLASCWVSACDICPVSSLALPQPGWEGLGPACSHRGPSLELAWPVGGPGWLGAQSPVVLAPPWLPGAWASPDGAGHLGVASPGPGWLLCCSTCSLLQPWAHSRLGSPCSPQA